MSAVPAERWATVRRVFDAAVELPCDQREEFLSSEDLDDGTRAEVMMLLDASDSAASANGETIATKVASPQGRLARLLAGGADHEAIIRQLYLASLCRMPTDAETAATRDIVTASPTPAEGYEDIFWALLNSKQFLFVH